MKLPEVDVNQARHFLRTLAPGEARFQFQTFGDNRDVSEDNADLTRARFGSLDEHLGPLTRLNRDGAAICVAVNQTDGAGRTKENITAIRALFLDLDGAPLTPVLDCGLRPHIITETSPNRYHAFWRVDGLEPQKFEACQLELAARFDGDPAVATLERCARLPGFFHRKSAEAPFRVRIIKTNVVSAYTAKEILAEFPPRSRPHKSSRSGLVLPAGAPLVAAQEFLQASCSDGDKRLLHHYRGSFYRYTGTHYREYLHEELERELYEFLNLALVKTKNGVAPFNPTKGKVQEISAALSRRALIPRDTELPAWLHSDEGASNLVACRNGILNLETRKLVPHDPLFVSTTCLPLDYDLNAPEPTQWLRFLNELWPGEKFSAEKETLQEIFGYLISSDTRQQKIFLIVGPARAGKGTIAAILTMLLGKTNVVSPTLSSLSREFGLWPLIDKRLAIVADARLGPKTDTHQIAERLLSISGGDQQSINRKKPGILEWPSRCTVFDHHK